LTKRNKVKQEDDGTYIPNGQSAKLGLNKSWLDAAFGQFFQTLEYIAEQAVAVAISQKPADSSTILSYRNEIICTDCIAVLNLCEVCPRGNNYEFRITSYELNF